jgi:outer membrane protein
VVDFPSQSSESLPIMSSSKGFRGQHPLNLHPRSVSWMLVWAIAAGAPVAAQDQPPLTLEDCIRLAIESPSPVRLAGDDAEIAARSLNAARAGLYPQAQASGGFVYNSPIQEGSDVQSFVSLDGVRVYDALVTAVQEIDTSGRLRATVARARADGDAAAARLTLARRDLKRAVAGAYYRLLFSRRLTRVAREALDEARSFESRTRLMFDRGEAARADVVKASSESAFLDQALQAAELEARLMNQELASFWTTNVDEPLNVHDVLDDPLPAPPEREQASEAPYLRRAEIDLLAAERRGFLEDSRGTRSELYPQASFVFQFGINSQQFDFADHGYAAFVNVSVPLFDWHRIRDTAQTFELRAHQVETDRAITERQFSLEYHSALVRAEMIHAQIDSTRSQVDLSRENLRLSRIRYEGGEGLALDVVAAQNQLTLASSNYYSTVTRYFTSLVDLEVASGR